MQLMRMKAKGLSRTVNSLRDGHWLTLERIRIYGLTCTVLFSLWLIHLLWGAENAVDTYGRPVGTDFSSFYAAGSLAAQGTPEKAYDWDALHQIEKNLFGENTPLYSWAYPAFALAPVSLLSRLPYLAALGLFLTLTFVVFWITLSRTAPRLRESFWALAGFPGIYVNIAYGQNGFLSAALMGSGLLALEKHPVAAGTAFGLLAYKPQLGLLIPVALIAGRHWCAFMTAAIVVMIQTAWSLSAYGIETWHAFAAALSASEDRILRGGATGFDTLQSVFAGARLVGASIQTAWSLQGLVAVVSGSIVWFAWRNGWDISIRNSVLIIASLLVSPFINPYDLVLLSLAIATLANAASNSETRPWQAIICLLAWTLPMTGRVVAATTGLPITPIVLLALLCYCFSNRSRSA
jgi:alpha-1,2-mannosyltransferase